MDLIIFLLLSSFRVCVCLCVHVCVYMYMVQRLMPLFSFVILYLAVGDRVALKLTFTDSVRLAA